MNRLPHEDCAVIISALALAGWFLFWIIYEVVTLWL